MERKHRRQRLTIITSIIRAGLDAGVGVALGGSALGAAAGDDGVP